MRIFLIGFMGSGKTSFGKRLANHLNLKFIDLDEQIEKKFKMSITSIFNKFDENTFRNLETITLKSIILEDNFILSCGGGTPCFNSNIELIKNYGISIYIKLNEKTLASRIQNSLKKRPLLDKLSEEELNEKIKNLLSQREFYYNQANYIIDGININIEDVIKKIF